MQRYRPEIKRNLSQLIIAAGITLLLSTTLQAAPNDCKALSEKPCGKSDTCSWIKGYTTKSGTKVKAYCRNKPKKGNSSKATSSKSKVVKKSEKESMQSTK